MTTEHIACVQVTYRIPLSTPNNESYDGARMVQSALLSTIAHALQVIKGIFRVTMKSVGFIDGL